VCILLCYLRIFSILSTEMIPRQSMVLVINLCFFAVIFRRAPDTGQVPGAFVQTEGGHAPRLG
jgi:hypothetical protein